MITRRTQIQPIALLITLVYFFLSGFMMVGTGEHAVTHGHGADHPAQHSTLICDWMCASASFVHASEPGLTQRFHPLFEKPAARAERFPNSLSIFSFYIRPPPISVA